MTNNPQSVFKVLAMAVEARLNCQRVQANASQHEWAVRWDERIKQLVRDFLPSGSGWDNGTTIDLDASHASKLVFTGSFHHMSESGYYDGWTDHTVTVTPSFSGINIRISGRDRNEIKDHLYQTFDGALHTSVVWNEARERYEDERFAGQNPSAIVRG